MLDRSSTTTTAAPRQTPAIRHIRTISATDIIKVDRTPGARGELALLWVRGLLDIQPRTAAMASTIFRCSLASAGRAFANSLEPANSADLLAYHWEQATDAERAAFGAAVGVTAVWDGAINPNL